MHMLGVNLIKQTPPASYICLHGGALPSPAAAVPGHLPLSPVGSGLAPAGQQAPGLLSVDFQSLCLVQALHGCG